MEGYDLSSIEMIDASIIKKYKNTEKIILKK